MVEYFGEHEAPEPYKDWADFFDHAPIGTSFTFAGETGIWTVQREPDSRGRRWQTANGLWGSTYHLTAYIHKGVYLYNLPGPTVPQTPGELTITQLVALEEFINKQLEEAYERGVKDGIGKASSDYDRGYSRGFDAGWIEGWDARDEG